MSDMRINPNAETRRVQRVNSERKTAKSKGADRSDKQADAVSISENARRIAKVPAVRTEKVEAVQNQLRKGEYVTEEKMKTALKNLLQDI